MLKKPSILNGSMCRVRRSITANPLFNPNQSLSPLGSAQMSVNTLAGKPLFSVE